jgi:cytochrome P450
MDLTTDFDHHDPGLHQDPAYWDRIDELRARYPIGYSTRYGGFWFLTSYAYVLRAFQDRTFVSSSGVSIPTPPTPRVAPIELDLPRQRVYRRDVNPYFTVEAVKTYEAGLRRLAYRLLDEIVVERQCDMARDYARKFPSMAFFEIVLHRPLDELTRVVPLTHTITYDPDPQRKGEAMVAMMHYCEELFSQRQAAGPKGDMLDAVMALDCDEVPFDDWLRLTGFSQLIQGGLGTSANLIGNIVRLLIDYPDIEIRVRQDRSLVDALIEEALRLHPPLNFIARSATVDTEVGDGLVRAGDRVLLVIAAANRDPDEFFSPRIPNLDRRQNRHLAFGAGIHRCIGSNLARLQVKVAIEALLDRVQGLRIPDGATIEYYSDVQRGPASFPVEFGPVAA